MTAIASLWTGIWGIPNPIPDGPPAGFVESPLDPGGGTFTSISNLGAEQALADEREDGDDSAPFDT